MQSIIDADERMKLQPLINQVIQETSEEYDDEDKSNLTASRRSAVPVQD
jgi:hypothetical protein